MAQQNRIEDAIGALRKALDLRSDDPDLYSFLGSLLEQQGSLRDAIAAWLKAVELGMDGPGAYRKLAILYGRQGKYDKALKWAYRALIGYGGALSGFSKRTENPFSRSYR